MEENIYNELYVIEYLAVRVKHNGFIQYPIHHFVVPNKWDILESEDGFYKDILFNIIEDRVLSPEKLEQLITWIPKSQKNFFLFALLFLSYSSFFLYPSIYRDTSRVESYFSQYKNKYPYLYVLFKHRVDYRVDCVFKGNHERYQLFLQDLECLENEELRWVIYAIVNSQTYLIKDSNYDDAIQYFLQRAPHSPYMIYVSSYIAQSVFDHKNCFENYDRLIQMYPDVGEYHLIKARHLYLAFGKKILKETFYHLNEAYKIFKRNQDTQGKLLYMLFLGKAYLYLEPEKWITILQQVGEKDIFYRNMCYIWVSNYCYETGDIPRSQLYYKKIDIEHFEMRPNHRLKLPEQYRK